MYQQLEQRIDELLSKACEVANRLERKEIDMERALNQLKCITDSIRILRSLRKRHEAEIQELLNTH